MGAVMESRMLFPIFHRLRMAIHAGMAANAAANDVAEIVTNRAMEEVSVNMEVRQLEVHRNEEKRPNKCEYRKETRRTE